MAALRAAVAAAAAAGLATAVLAVVPSCAVREVGYEDPLVPDVNGGVGLPDAEACQTSCYDMVTCKVFTYYRNSGGCWLQGLSGTIPPTANMSGVISGPRECPSVEATTVEAATAVAPIAGSPVEAQASESTPEALTTSGTPVAESPVVAPVVEAAPGAPSTSGTPIVEPPGVAPVAGAGPVALTTSATPVVESPVMAPAVEASTDFPTTSGMVPVIEVPTTSDAPLNGDGLAIPAEGTLPPFSPSTTTMMVLGSSTTLYPNGTVAMAAAARGPTTLFPTWVLFAGITGCGVGAVLLGWMCCADKCRIPCGRKKKAKKRGVTVDIEEEDEEQAPLMGDHDDGASSAPPTNRPPAASQAPRGSFGFAPLMPSIPPLQMPAAAPLQVHPLYAQQGTAHTQPNLAYAQPPAACGYYTQSPQPQPRPQPTTYATYAQPMYQPMDLSTPGISTARAMSMPSVNYGQLFDQLDRNADGALSIREPVQMASAKR